MQIESTEGDTRIFTTWTEIVAQATARKLKIQYLEVTTGDFPHYDIFVIDDKVVYTTTIFTGTIPAVSDYASQAANDADETDFVTNYQPTANHRVAPEVFDLDTGGTFEYSLGVSLRKAAGGGSVAFGTSTDPVRTDPTGTTTQPVSGSLTITSIVPGTGATNLGKAEDAPHTTGDVGVLSLAVRNDALAALTSTDLDYSPIAVNSAGAVRIDPTGTTTQPISGTVAVSSITTSVTPGTAATNLGKAEDSGHTTGDVGVLSLAVRNDALAALTSTDLDYSPIAVNSAGVIRIDPTGTTTQPISFGKLAGFTVLATATTIGNNKSMLSLLNAAASTVIVKIDSIYVVNAQTTSVTGVVGNFELRRITGHSGGTAITAIETMDTNDALNGSVTARTGSTVAGESATLLWRTQFSTDEWGTGAADVESADHIFQVMFPVWGDQVGTAHKPITLRANQGLTVKFTTNSTAGSFDIMAVITQE